MVALTLAFYLLTGASPQAKQIELLPIAPKMVFDLAKKSGAALTLVNFWASWCGPCRKEFPDLLRFRAEWQKKNVVLEFVSVDFDQDIPDAKKFLGEMKVDFPTYLRTGDDQTLIQTIDPKWAGALPTTFVLNRKGEIVLRIDGPVQLKALEGKISYLLNQQSKGK
jgi:thiol-disulfide isomerase/thioredoxin